MLRAASLSLLLLALPAAASADAVDDFLARLGEASKGTRTLDARFTQTKRAALFRSVVKSRGLIYFERPDRLRWETFSPDAATLLVVGNRAEFRVPGESPRRLDLRQGGTLGALVQQLLVWLGARPGTDLRRHQAPTLRAEKGRTRLVLVPKDPQLRKRIAALELAFALDYSLRSIEVRQSDGDSTLVELTSFKRNASLPAGAFR
jgi:outer membrane lipoprotein carrier protein